MISTTSPQLPLAHYQFNFKVLQELHLPAFSGSLWHSVLGKALRESVCFNHHQRCESCAFLHYCDYSLLFSAPRPPHTQIMRHYQTIPVPHIIRFENTNPLHLLENQSLSLELILIAKASEKLPLIIQVLIRAVAMGLGKQRSQLQLKEVVQININTLPRLIYSSSKLINLSLLNTVPVIAMPEKVTLRFISPYKQSTKTHDNELINVPAFLMALVRRVSLLQYFYTDKQLLADFKQLKTVAEQLIVLNSELFVQSQKRYSSKHKKEINVDWVLGCLVLDLRGAELLWDYLYLGQWLNVGKNASMGFGRYELLI